MTQHLSEACADFVKAAFLDVLASYKTSRFDQDLPAYGTSLSLARIRAFSTRDSIHSHTGVVLLEMLGSGPVASEFRRGSPQIAPWGFRHPSCPRCDTASILVKVSSGSKKKSGLNFKCKCGVQTHTVAFPKNVSIVPLDFIADSHYIFPFPHPVSLLEVPWSTPEGEVVVALWDGSHPSD